MQDYSTSQTDDLSCHVTLAFTTSQLTMTSTGIPNHDFESGNGCCAAEKQYTATFTLQPALASTVTYAPERGVIGWAVNGVPLYGPEDNDDADVVRVTRESPTATPRLELCDGHSTPQGTYHYHADANCVHWHPAGGSDWNSYSFDALDKMAHSKIVGFALDGFPIYGSFGYGADGQVREITSSYRLKSGADGSNGIDDYEYVAGLGDLDECNGHTTTTPDFPSGIYAYHSTLKNGAGDLGFPYLPLCYKGTASGSGMSGPAPGGMGGTSPSPSPPSPGGFGGPGGPPPPPGGQV